MHKYKRILFVVKKGQRYSINCGGSYAPTGLRNSAEFVVDMLVDNKVDAKLVQVVDNNDIDREVYSFKPDIVVIEALWVVPSKFEVLKKLHPKVIWVIRIHSELPFLAQEGIAIEWIKEYAPQDKLFVSVNSEKAYRDFAYIVPKSKLIYLPNFFPTTFTDDKFKSRVGTVNVSSFGAIRPLKNQLIQAVSAIAFAERDNNRLFFHINGTRVEHGQEVLSNIRALFSGTKHTLVEHDWLSHKDFKDVLRHMDVSMCMSLSESFCIVAADSVSVGTPLVCSPEVSWASAFSQAEPTDLADTVTAMERVYKFGALSTYLNQRRLKAFSKNSESMWLDFVKK